MHAQEGPSRAAHESNHRVSGQALPMCIEIAREGGLDPDQLFRHVSVDYKDPPEWVHWDDFCEIIDVLEEHFTSAELTRLGKVAFKIPEVVRLVRIAGLFGDHRRLIYGLHRFVGRRIFPLIKSSIVDHGRDKPVTLTLELPEGARGSFGYFAVSRGNVPEMFSSLGMKLPRVDARHNDRRVEFSLWLPERKSLWTRLKLMARWFRGTEAAVAELASQARALQEQLDEAESRRREADRARVRAEAARRDAESARVLAERALNTQSNFMDAMSHELRTPLNHILGLGQLLELEPMSDEGLTYLSTLQDSSQHLLGLINQVLDFRKLAMGRLVLQPRMVEVEEMLFGALRGLEEEAEDKGLNFVIHLDKDLPRQLHMDPLRLGQVIRAVTENAVLYTSHGGIKVTVGLVEETLEIQVHDTGAGLSEAELKLVFQPFTHRDEDPDAPRPGVGLSLPLAQELMKAMGGELGVTSHPGRGSTFWIRHPLDGVPGQTPLPLGGS